MAWSTITLPTTEGDLGVKCLLDWNKALILKHLAQLIQFHSNSTWAEWAKATILKGRSLWQLSIPNDCSWIWKQVLKLRTIALPHLQYHVGRGDKINLWYDPWLHGEALNPNPSLISNSGLPATATVSSILQNSVWTLPASNYHDVILFCRRIELCPPPSQTADCVRWGNWDIHTVKASQIWESIRHRHQLVPWHPILWNKLHVPRYSFIMWLGLLKRLQTNDRTQHYTGRIFNCPLCKQRPETFDHLFFNCNYSLAVFKAVMDLGNWPNLPMCMG